MKVKQKDIEVSVVCIAYNQEKYIAKMLESLLAQKTTFNYEILIHDDASKDKTQDIIRKYQKKYPETIKPILQTENQFSKGNNPNIMFNYPRVIGKYVAFCEGDDYWSDSNKLQLQYEALQKHTDCAICVHNTQCVSNTGERINRSFPPVNIKGGVITAQEYIKMELCSIGWLFQTSSYFIRTEVIKKYVQEYNNVYPVGDLPLVLFSLHKGNCYYIPKSMSCYRTNSGGVMTNLQDVTRKISHLKKMIAGHENFDKFTDYQYHADFQYAIQNYTFEILYLQGEYKRLLKFEHRQFFKQQSNKRKAIIFIGTLSPQIAKYILRKKGKKNE
ncbi:glycosyltransferase [Hungatella sp. L12]|uniref:Glycosyltransferase n=1 Tax=Hungatella hominis TaxID=2763050 RepID=A0ABR7HBK5_9FIRM|nr:glycosyltransferase [Hungatella hominis]MBC5710570.1 glycosyltransferase [Hungatella hominis]